LIKVYDATGRPQESLTTLRAAVQAMPRDPYFAARLAWRLSTATDARAHDVSDALEYAMTAISLQPEAAVNHDILAAAQANAGEFEQAIASASLALGLARDAGQSDLAAGIELRLNLYRSGQPYRRP